jgi:hypothetical protein
MKNQIAKLMVAIAFATAVVAGTITSCDDNDNLAAPGTGTGGIAGTSTGGTGGVANLATYNVTLDGMSAVPPTGSTGTGTAVVVLNKTTGDVTVTGTFNGLGTSATGAHIYGPAAAGQMGQSLVTLTVPSLTQGTITGTARMDPTTMNNMLNQMTYIAITTSYFPDGEIRAQIK